MPSQQEGTPAGVIAAKPQPVVETFVLNDPVVRYLALANLRRGVPAADVAAALGMCADTLCALLGVEADA